jgi:hypothetical protein
MPEAGEPKKVPKRVDVKPQGLIKNTGEIHLYGQDPEYVYQSFSQNPESPGYLDNFTHEHLYGQGQPFCQWIGAWEVVNSQTDRTQASQGTTAQGTPVDTRQRGPGNQIIARIHKSEYAKYAETDRANSGDRAKELGSPDVRREAFNSTTTVLREGEVPFAQALSDAGHPMPGMRQA